MVATVIVLPVPTPPPPAPEAPKLMPPCDARTAHLCPACGVELARRGCYGVCVSECCKGQIVSVPGDG